MAGHDTILGWPREKFERVVEGLEKSFERGAASLYFDTHAAAHLIDVFRPEDSGFEPHEWAELRPLIGSLDQFLVYAFEAAPDRVIKRWARDHGDDLEEEAVARIAHLRDHAPTIAQQWLARATTVNYALGDLQSDLVINPAANNIGLLLRLDVFIPGPAPRRSPLASSRQWVSFVADGNEVERLIAKLQYFKSLISNDDDNDDSAVGSSGDEDAENAEGGPTDDSV